jgi:hypothetical protein
MANVGNVDRGIRFVAGLLLIALCILPPSAPLLGGLGTWTWVALAAGAILIVTAAIRFCPAYRLIGANTCGR